MSERLSVWKIERNGQSDIDDTHYFEEGVTAEHVKATLIEEGFMGEQDEVYCDYVEGADLIPNF